VSQCCVSSQQGCYKQADSSSHFAMCKGLPKRPEGAAKGGGSAACQNSPQWLCPGWEKCSPQGADCLSTRCCSNPSLSCYLKSEAEAKCLPTGSCESEWMAPLAFPLCRILNASATVTAMASVEPAVAPALAQSLPQPTTAALAPAAGGGDTSAASTALLKHLDQLRSQLDSQQRGACRAYV
jgi:hypothetical protein